MINRCFAKLIILITTMLLTGCALALVGLATSGVLDDAVKEVVNNVSTPEQSANATPTTTETTANNPLEQNTVENESSTQKPSATHQHKSKKHKHHANTSKKQ